MEDTEQNTHTRQSLRFRYIVVAVMVALFLVGGSIAANKYAKNVSARNAAALQLRDTVTETIGGIRYSIWRADTALNAMLISPQTAHQQTIKNNLRRAETSLQSLADDSAIESAGLADIISDLQLDLGVLRENVYRLMELRKDPNWVYPMLPFISTTLLESNTEFEDAVSTALNEIAANDGETYASDLYRRVDQVRDLWRLKILNFRAAIIRFAGLNRLERISQERNIDLIHEQIQAELAELERLKEKGLLGFETEAALETMQYRSDKWYQDFQELKKLRDSKIWRADIHFLGVNVRPHQAHVFNDFTELEKRISGWSSDNVAAVEQAASQISIGLWGVSGLALGIVILVYIMIDRSVLKPVARVAAAISEEGGVVEPLKLPRKGSREIHSLIKAFNDMQQQIRHRQLALEYQALHDSLTGLPNRALLNDRLEQGIHLAHRNATSLVLMLLDLDRFKEINDTLGHPVGDRVLQTISQRLTGVLRESDTIARLGGDEFAIILPDASAEQTKVFVEKIIAAIDQVIDIEKQNLYVTSSIGIAVYPEHGEVASNLIRHADIAMYRAKQSSSAFSFYEDAMEKHSVDNLSLLGDLRNELERQVTQIGLHYQPKIDLFSREVLGVEALLRWNHPRQGYIHPDQVIRMAEQSGLIGGLSSWVMEQAFRDSAAWRDDGIDIGVAVNLSAWNLQDPGLPALVEALLVKYKISPDKFTLEITESAVMSDPIRASEVLQQLNTMGVSLAIDDYGTGFSSLAYLKLLPVHALKIDKSFVIDMLDDENDAIIVRSTIDLAHNLGLKVVAEGVENNQVSLRLRKLKCDAAQGFYFSRPIPELQFRDWYRRYNPKAAL